MKNRIKTTAVALLALIFVLPLTGLAQDDCFVAVEKTASYEKLVVTTIALTMIRQFIDPNVKPAPISGFSEKGCIYLVNVAETSDGVKVFLFGENISDYGNSGLRGEAGLEQAMLRTVFKGVKEVAKQNAICDKYGKILEVECVKLSLKRKSEQQKRLASIPDSRPGLFVNSSPPFSISYPPKWENTEPERMSEVLRIESENDLKVLSIEINNESISLDDFIADKKPRIKKRWEKRGADEFRTAADKEISLSDGTRARLLLFNATIKKRRTITRFQWMLAAKKGDSTVVVVIVAGRKKNVYQKIIKSLTFY